MIVSRNGNVIFSNVSGPSKEAIAAGVTAATALGVAAVSKQKPLSEVEQKCGKKPLFPGKRKKAWDNCAAGFASTASAPQQTPPPLPLVPKTKIPVWVWIVGGVVLAGGIGFAIYRSTKK